MRDKPGVQTDYYHTCYCLSGLASIQHYSNAQLNRAGLYDLAQADPLCNVVAHKLSACWEALGSDLWCEPRGIDSCLFLQG